MQRIFSLVKTISSARIGPAAYTQMPILSTFQQFARERLLQPALPIVNPVCGFKVKGRVRRRCKSCYFVVRDERLYVICPKSPRHKQMAMKPKPLNTYILTHASQSPVRPW